MSEARQVFNDADLQLYKGCQSIKNRHRDGEPLREVDREFILKILKRHPRASHKIGTGVKDIVLGSYVCNTRCFFVIRNDGTVEDFSIRRCLGAPVPRRSERIRLAMQSFRPGRLVTLYRLFVSGVGR